jgi:hypothetical protein
MAWRSPECRSFEGQNIQLTERHATVGSIDGGAVFRRSTTTIGKTLARTGRITARIRPPSSACRKTAAASSLADSGVRFGKLLINFTWWVNRKDRLGKSVFEGSRDRQVKQIAIEGARGSPSENIGDWEE